jgi:hypothetical protein
MSIHWFALVTTFREYFLETHLKPVLAESSCV